MVLLKFVIMNFLSVTCNFQSYRELALSLFFLTLLPIFITACEQKSEYEQRLETELAKDVRVDSLFLGYYLGMPQEEFFEHSWQLNQQEIVTGQRTINYQISELKSPASMDFYPQFKDGKIYQMPVEVHYDGWAPWNREFFSDTLMIEMVDLYEEKYGSNFFKSVHPESKKQAYIDIQGNRRISIFKRDDRIVTIEFLDLTAVENNL